MFFLLLALAIPPALADNQNSSDSTYRNLPVKSTPSELSRKRTSPFDRELYPVASNLTKTHLTYETLALDSFKTEIALFKERATPLVKTLNDQFASRPVEHLLEEHQETIEAIVELLNSPSDLDADQISSLIEKLVATRIVLESWDTNSHHYQRALVQTQEENRRFRRWTDAGLIVTTLFLVSGIVLKDVNLVFFGFTPSILFSRLVQKGARLSDARIGEIKSNARLSAQGMTAQLIEGETQVVHAVADAIRSRSCEGILSPEVRALALAK